MMLTKRLLFFGAFSLLSTRALAQGVRIEHCRPQASLQIGFAGNADRNGDQADAALKTTHRSPDASAAVDIPVADPWSIRTEFGRSFPAVFQTSGLEGPVVRDSVMLERLTVTGTKTGQPCGSSFRAYAGLGLGVYRYHFDAANVSTIRSGVTGTAGVDVNLGDRQALSAFIGLDGIDGPKRPPVFSTLLLVLRYGVGMTVRF
jgi:hypothetical protein